MKSKIVQSRVIFLSDPTAGRKWPPPNCLSSNLDKAPKGGCKKG